MGRSPIAAIANPACACLCGIWRLQGVSAHPAHPASALVGGVGGDVDQGAGAGVGVGVIGRHNADRAAANGGQGAAAASRVQGSQ